MWKLYIGNGFISDVTQLLNVSELFLTCRVFLKDAAWRKKQRLEVRLNQICKDFFFVLYTLKSGYDLL